MKVLFILITFILTLIVGLGVMIYGWGLTPQNWYVISGGWLFLLFLQTLQHIAKD